MVDIILAKIERTKSIKLKPSEMTRRYPLLLGWPYFFQLLRAGAIGSFKTAPKIRNIQTRQDSLFSVDWRVNPH